MTHRTVVGADPGGFKGLGQVFCLVAPSLNKLLDVAFGARYVAPSKPTPPKNECMLIYIYIYAYHMYIMYTYMYM